MGEAQGTRRGQTPLPSLLPCVGSPPQTGPRACCLPSTQLPWGRPGGSPQCWAPADAPSGTHWWRRARTATARPRGARRFNSRGETFPPCRLGPPWPCARGAGGCRSAGCEGAAGCPRAGAMLGLVPPGLEAFWGAAQRNLLCGILESHRELK